MLQMWLIKFHWMVVDLIDEKAWTEIHHLFMQLTQFDTQKAEQFCVASSPCQVQVLMEAIYSQPEGDDCTQWTSDWMHRICKWIQRDFGTMGFHPDKQVSNGAAMVERATEWYSLGQGIISMLKLLIDAFPYATKNNCNPNIEPIVTISIPVTTFQFDESQYQKWQQQQQELFRRYGAHNAFDGESSTHFGVNETSETKQSAKELESALSQLDRLVKIQQQTAVAKVNTEGKDEKIRMRCVKRRLIGEEPVIYYLTVSKVDGPLKDIESCLFEVLDTQPNIWHSRTSFLTTNSRINKIGSENNSSMAKDFLSAMEDCRDESKHKSYTAITRINSVKLLGFCRRKLDSICDYSMQFPVPADAVNSNPDTNVESGARLLIKRATNDKSWLFQLRK